MRKIFTQLTVAVALLLSLGVSEVAAQFCNQAQSTPGFPSNPQCQVAVCNADPFCCDNSWDSVCALTAATFPECNSCGLFCNVPQGGPGFPSNSACQAIVCADDPFCCDSAWDSVCADAAAGYFECASCLGLIGCDDPSASNYVAGAVQIIDCEYIFCDEPQATAGFAGNPECAAAVCADDSFCCATIWDAQCAANAPAYSACQSCLTPIVGCMNPLAVNYDASATVDSGCIYFVDVCCYNLNGALCPLSDCANDVCLIDLFCCETVWDGFCALEALTIPSCACPPSGCTNPIATNYDPNAIIDDFSCEYDPFICCEAIEGGYDCPFSGCQTDVCAEDPFCCDNSWDGICAQTAIVTPSCNCAPGCTNPIATNYNPDAVYDDGSCEYDPFVCCEAIEGGFACPFTDCEADVCAVDAFCCDNAWDGICAEQAITTPSCNCSPGCTHPAATNYSPEAVYDDGSCDFAPNVCCEFLGFDLCPISECASIVCENDAFCCNESWDSFCVAAALEIDECNCGVPTSVTELGNDTGFSMFPNPNTGGFVNITLNGLEASNNDVVVRFFNIAGKMVSQNAFAQVGNEFSRVIQFNETLATGLYVVDVTVNGKQFAVEKLVVR